MSYFIFFFKQKTAYEMRISDWSSDVCSSDQSICWFSISSAAFGNLSRTGVRRRETSRRRSHRNYRISWLSRSEEHTSELQSLMRISYAVFCLKKKKKYVIRDIP